MNTKEYNLDKIAKKLSNIDKDSEQYLLGILEGYSKAYDFLHDSKDFKALILKDLKIA